MEPLRIHLLGGFLLEREDAPLPPIASRTGRSVFAYLAVNRGRPISRDLLAGIFWPELPDGRARRRLSHTLWQIQDVVNADSGSHLRITSDTLAFDDTAPYWLDTEQFDLAFDALEKGGETDWARATRLRSCVELYRGDFLAGYFDDWVIVEQDHYRQRYLMATRRLVDATKATGSYDEALGYARRLTHHDVLDEEAHREVMRLNFLLGRTSEAVEQFERVRSVLSEELGAEPSTATREIYEKILRQRKSGIRPLSEAQKSVMLGRNVDSPFVGRDHERRLIVDALEQVLGGSGGVVLVEGEPGVGKTRLTLEAAEDARWRGFEVSWGSCRPGAVRPYAPLVEVLDSLSPLRIEQLHEQLEPIWLSEAGRLSSAIGRKSSGAGTVQLRPAEESTRMIEALVHTLEALGQIAPHLVVIDDVHWADQDTLTVLRQLGDRLATSRVLLLILYRSEEARGNAATWDVLRELDRVSGLGRAVMSPLSVFELEEMVRRILGIPRLDSNVAAQFHRQTGGNVLFTLETLLAVRDRGLFGPDADPAAVLETQLTDNAIPVAPRVRSIIESRIALLGHEVFSVYELAAVLGDDIGLELLEAVTDLDRPLVLQAVDELLYRGLIVEDSDSRYRIAHDQVRQVVYEATESDRRIAFHLRAAEAMTSLDPDNVEAIGHHYYEGGDADNAACYLMAAGLRSIAVSAYATARQHLRSACRISAAASMNEMERYVMLGHLEDVLDVLGRRDEQAEVLDEMATLAGHLDGLQGDTERRRAWLQAQEADLLAAEKSALRAVELGSDLSHRAASAPSLVALGTIRRWSGRPLEAVAPLEEALTLSETSSDRARALTELASTLVEVHRLDEALSHLAEASEIYDAEGDLRGQAEVAGIEARAMRLDGRRDEAVDRFESAIALCRRIGYRHGEGVNLTNLANLHQLVGSVMHALDGYDRAARIFETLGNKRGEAMVLANSASARHSILGNDVRASVDAAKAMRHFAEIGDRARRAQCLEIVAGVAARAGDIDEARRLLEESLDDLRDVGNSDLEGQHLRSLTLLALQEGDLAAAQVALDEADGLVASAHLDALASDLMSIRGLIERASGDVDRALASTREAVASMSPGAERPYLIHHRHALVSEAAGELDEARVAGVTANDLLLGALAGLSPDDRSLAIEAVPEHRAITERAERLAPRTIEVRLRPAHASSSGPGGEEDVRLISWTVEHPEDDHIADEIDRRRRRVLRLIEEAEANGAVPATKALADALGVSATTIRRDLSALRATDPERFSGHRRVAS